jgi:hypothetical protein
VDHIDPTSLGGDDHWTNWSGCCHHCNAIKSNLPLLQAMLWMPVNKDYHAMRRLFFSPGVGGTRDRVLEKTAGVGRSEDVRLPYSGTDHADAA